AVRAGAEPVGPWRDVSFLQQLPHRQQRYRGPRRPVVHLVAELVHGLLEQVRIEQHFDLRLGWRQEPAVPHGFEVLLEKARSDGVVPALPERDARDTLVRPSDLRVKHARMRSVMIRAQHPGDVAQWRALDTTLAQRPYRLPLEVRNDEVATGEQHLAEVVVAVRAYALAMQFAVDDAAEPGEQSLFETEYRTRIGGCICRQPSELALQQRERP